MKNKITPFILAVMIVLGFTLIKFDIGRLNAFGFIGYVLIWINSILLITKVILNILFRRKNNDENNEF